MTGDSHLTRLLRDHHADVAADNRWQQQARLVQSLWRERQGLLPGPRSPRNDEPLGSRLTMTDAAPATEGGTGTMCNYLSPASRTQVLRAVQDAPGTGALLSRPRLWVDLLSSQPLCFNLFGPLAADHSLATSVLSELWPGRIRNVTHVGFEYSPGRGDARYTGNRSAFDVFVKYDGPRGPGFLGIEVKYHENLTGAPISDPAGRYATLARGSGAFHDHAIARLSAPPLQQLWLDHLLALRLRQAEPDRYAEGAFVLLYPAGNARCVSAAAAYADCLVDPSTFEAVTLDRVLSVGSRLAPGGWADPLFDRYLDTRPLAENTATRRAA